MLDDVTRSWWYEQDGQHAGPVSVATIHGLLVTGQLTPGHRVWRDGLAEWVPLQHVSELAPVMQAAVTARPQPGVPLPPRPPALAPRGAEPPAAYAPPAPAFHEVSLAGVILLSVITLGIYGLVKFYGTGKAYERLAGRESRFTLYFWLFVGLAIAGVLFFPLGLASLVFQFLTLAEALEVRAEGMRRWGVAAQVTDASTHKTYLVLGMVLSIIVVGVVFTIIQAVKWFEDWNAIGKAAQGRLA